MRGKTVKVSEETHIKLSLLKIKTKAKTFNDVIRMLIEKCGESVE
jgi:predicted CopG family antitoxin